MGQLLRVQVVIDTDELRRWAIKHHLSVAAALTAAADHYEALNASSTPPPPIYPRALDVVELRHWANWHTDRAPAGVAHILHEAAGSYQGE